MSNRAKGENIDEPRVALAQSAPKRTGSSQHSRSILNLCRTHRISIEGRPAGHQGRSLERLMHLPGCRLRSSGIPHEGYADPITNDRPRFHSNVAVSELTELVTRAIEASDVSSAPLVAETMDGVTHETRPTPRPRPALGSVLHRARPPGHARCLSWCPMPGSVPLETMAQNLGRG